MKKLIKTVAVLMAAALAVGSLASCKMNAELGDNWKPWKVDSTVKGEARTITLINDSDTEAIAWWCWTDEKGQILTDEKINPSARTLEAGKKCTFTFPDEKTYKLNIYVADKPLQTKAGKGRKGFDINNSATYLDFRGKITPHSKDGKVIKTSGFGQGVTRQGEFWFTNDEPVDNSFFKSTNGDYTVEEVWVLEQKESDIKEHGTDPDGNKHKGAKYTAREDLKYKKLAIGQNETAGFLVPVVDKSGTNVEVVVALEQPKRAVGGETKKLKHFIYKDGRVEFFDGMKDKKQNVVHKLDKAPAGFGGKTNLTIGGVTKTYETWAKDWTEVQITSSQLSEKKAEFWAKRVKIAPMGKSETFNSSEMNDAKFDRSGITDNFTNLNGKNALGIEIVEVIPAVAGEK